MNSLKYFALVAVSGLIVGIAQPAFCAPAVAASPAAAASAAPAKKAEVASSTSTISSFSTGKSITLKAADPKGKNQTFYINKSTVIAGKLAKGATAQVWYNPSTAKNTKTWAVKIAVK